jgi:hypothetical protein
MVSKHATKGSKTQTPEVSKSTPKCKREILLYNPEERTSDKQTHKSLVHAEHNKNKDKGKNKKKKGLCIITEKEV